MDLRELQNEGILPMSSETEKEIYTKAAELWGVQFQVNVAIEEMSELTKELCKFNRREVRIPNIAEEIADVHIMLEQLIEIFHVREQVEQIKGHKIKRLGVMIRNAGR